VYPVWVDVFPLIGLPDDAKERHLFFTEYKELEKRIWEDFYAQDGDISVFSKWFPRQKEFFQRYEFDRTEYVGVLGTAYGERDSTGRAVYEQTLRLPFENIEVNVAAGYQEYLDHLYGTDWMQLPEESKRKSHHELKAYWM
jgi:lipopolysaccharide cholinephosphotransferase